MDKRFLFMNLFAIFAIVFVLILSRDKSTSESIELETTTEMYVAVLEETEAVTESAAVDITENDTVTMALDKLWDVPLEAELQIYIDALCVSSPIEPEIILAMCERESQYTPDAIGDGGESFGLLQIKPKWHQERMDRLDCPDLLNPYNNVTVALDLLDELYERYEGDMALVLMAYNGGYAYAERQTEPSDYALFVLNRAAELREVRNSY